MYKLHKKAMYIFVYFAYCNLVHVNVQYNQKERRENKRKQLRHRRKGGKTTHKGWMG